MNAKIHFELSIVEPPRANKRLDGDLRAPSIRRHDRSAIVEPLGELQVSAEDSQTNLAIISRAQSL